MVDAKLIDAYECPICNSVYRDIDNARDCFCICSEARDPDTVNMFECSECQKLYEEIEHAEQCCKSKLTENKSLAYKKGKEALKRLRIRNNM